MARIPRLFVISGPSGAGKGTLVARIRDQRPDLGLTVSATTRCPRDGEVDGETYHFLSEKDFAARVERGEFLEWADVHGHRYGTLKSEVDQRIADGKSVILEIDVQGAFNVRRVYPDAVLIFIEPPSAAVLEERLRGRGTEDEASVELRLSNARDEMRLASKYDARVVNDDLCQATEDLARLLDLYETNGGNSQDGSY